MLHLLDSGPHTSTFSLIPFAITQHDLTTVPDHYSHLLHLLDTDFIADTQSYTELRSLIWNQHDEAVAFRSEMRGHFNNLELRILGQLQGLESQIVSLGDLVVDSQHGVCSCPFCVYADKYAEDSLCSHPSYSTFPKYLLPLTSYHSFSLAQPQLHLTSFMLHLPLFVNRQV